MKVIFWSDFVCPFCWIGNSNLKKAIVKSGLQEKVQLEMRSFQLFPTIRDVDDKDTLKILEETQHLSPEKAKERIESIDKAGREAGLDLDYGNVRNANTYDAHRLMKYAMHQDAKKAEVLADLIFKAVFTDHLVISDREVLKSLMKKAGFEDTAAVNKVLQSDMYGMEVLQDGRDAHREGVRSIPYYIFGDFAMPGAYKVDELVEVIKHFVNEGAEAIDVPNHKVYSTPAYAMEK